MTEEHFSSTAQTVVDSTSPYSHQRAVLKACASGDTDALQEVFNELHIKTRDEVPDYWRDSNGKQSPLTSTMLCIAITHHHYHIITLIMRTFTRVYTDPDVIDKILDTGDVDALRSVHAYDKDVVNYTFDDRWTIYTRACHGPPERTGPILVFLGEHGVDFEGGPLRLLSWNLVPAISCGHSVEVLEVLARHGAKIDTLAVENAIKDKRGDVLQLIIDKGGLTKRGHLSWEDVAGEFRKAALGTDDVSIFKFVEELLALEKEKNCRREDGLAGQSKKGWFKFF